MTEQGRKGNINTYKTPLHTSCDGRVVKALDLKSNGVSPRRFEPCSQRKKFFNLPGFYLLQNKHMISKIPIGCYSQELLHLNIFQQRLVYYNNIC